MSETIERKMKSMDFSSIHAIKRMILRIQNNTYPIQSKAHATVVAVLVYMIRGHN